LKIATTQWRLRQTKRAEERGGGRGGPVGAGSPCRASLTMGGGRLPFAAELLTLSLAHMERLSHLTLPDLSSSRRSIHSACTALRFENSYYLGGRGEVRRAYVRTAALQSVSYIGRSTNALQIGYP